MSDHDTSPPHDAGNPDPSRLEADQPDPMLRMSGGGMTTAGMWLAALAIVAILVVVFWGLNSPTNPERLNTPPSSTAATHNSGAPNG